MIGRPATEPRTLAVGRTLARYGVRVHTSDEAPGVVRVEPAGRHSTRRSFERSVTTLALAQRVLRDLGAHVDDRHADDPPRPYLLVTASRL